MMNFENFVTESNRIEGILRPPTVQELSATADFVLGPMPTVNSLCKLARVYAPDKGLLRNQKGMNVRVGSHVAPPGGSQLHDDLIALLATIEDADPFEFHIAYETLHPFLDGNGRTGRALWAWQVFNRGDIAALDRGFLHSFYCLCPKSCVMVRLLVRDLDFSYGNGFSKGL